MVWPGRNGGGVPPGFPGSSDRRGGNGGGDGRAPRRIRPARRLEPTSPERDEASPSSPAASPGREAANEAVDDERDEAAADQPERKVRLRHATQASVTRLATRWPGQGGAGAPAGFPGSTSAATGGRDVGPDSPGVSADDDEADSEADEPKTIVIRTNPLFRRSSAERSAADAERGDLSGEHRRLRRLRAVAGRVPRKFNGVVAAVYAALGDPLVNPSEAVRARRSAQVRRVGTLAASAAVGAVMVYAIFPVRTYLDQRSSTQSREEELDVLSDANERLGERAEELRDQQTVEEIARHDYGLIFPGEEPYAVLPAPESTTTTTAP